MDGNKPQGMADHLEQLREPILRGSGTTRSERYLALLAEKSFLNLWSYPNAYRDQRKADGTSVGKELCDLLIVCGPHVIIFSEKTIGWPQKALDVAWPRWFRKAIWESVDQLRGAERWITTSPDRIFIDASCKTPLPIPLPPQSERIVHRVIVAQGAGDACRAHFGISSGSLRICADVKARDHFEPTGAELKPFCVGDVDPRGPFVRRSTRPLRSCAGRSDTRHNHE